MLYALCALLFDINGFIAKIVKTWYPSLLPSILNIKGGEDAG